MFTMHRNHKGFHLSSAQVIKCFKPQQLSSDLLNLRHFVRQHPDTLHRLWPNSEVNLKTQNTTMKHTLEKLNATLVPLNQNTYFNDFYLFFCGSDECSSLFLLAGFLRQHNGYAALLHSMVGKRRRKKEVNYPSDLRLRRLSKRSCVFRSEFVPCCCAALRCIVLDPDPVREVWASCGDPGMKDETIRGGGWLSGALGGGGQKIDEGKEEELKMKVEGRAEREKGWFLSHKTSPSLKFLCASPTITLEILATHSEETFLLRVCGQLAGENLTSPVKSGLKIQNALKTPA